MFTITAYSRICSKCSFLSRNNRCFVTQDRYENIIVPCNLSRNWNTYIAGFFLKRYNFIVFRCKLDILIDNIYPPDKTTDTWYLFFMCLVWKIFELAKHGDACLSSGTWEADVGRSLEVKGSLVYIEFLTVSPSWTEVTGWFLDQQDDSSVKSPYCAILTTWIYAQSAHSAKSLSDLYMHAMACMCTRGNNF